MRKFVEAMIRADAEKGHPFVKAYERSHTPIAHSEVIIDMREFTLPITVRELSQALNAEFAAGEDRQKDLVYGYTVIDSIKAILEFSSEDFLKLYGATTQRALIFTKVSYGRSPLIAIRVSNIKPKVVVMHGVNEIDPLGLKIARIEMIPVLLTKMLVEELLKELRRHAS